MVRGSVKVGLSDFTSVFAKFGKSLFSIKFESVGVPVMSCRVGMGVDRGRKVAYLRILFWVICNFFCWCREMRGNHMGEA